MGLSFRKSIKIGKNTRINLSKNGGIGISTGVKHARVSVNQKGVRATVGKGGLQYRKDVSFKNINNNRNNAVKTVGTNKNKTYNNEEKELRKAILLSPEITEFNKQSYTTHMKLFMFAVPAFIIGLVFVPIMLIAMGLIVAGLVCMGMNWNRINEEHKARKNIEADVRKRLTEPVESVINENYEF